MKFRTIMFGFVALALVVGASACMVPVSPPSTTPVTPCTPGATGTPTTGPMWKPTSTHALGFHWVLGAALNTNDPVQMGRTNFSGQTLPEPAIYDIDGECNSAATVATLHAAGKKVICYIDVGAYETYRGDAAAFPKSVIGAVDHGWDGSFWLDIRKISTLAPIMQARIANCAAKGFDAVEPDELDAYVNTSGFPLTAADQFAYNSAVAGWVHDAGMSVLLKGDIDQAAALEPFFDFTLNEECNLFANCSPGLDAFSNAGKAVFIAEYPNDTPVGYPVNTTGAACQNAVAKHWNLSWYKLGLPSTGARQPCAGTW